MSPGDGGGGAVVWFTGLPSSGKSTLARAVQARLREISRPACLLDGDEVRDCLRPPPGYDAAGRDAFYESLARLAALLAGQGLLVLAPATAHRRAYVERARRLAPAFLEVFVDTPLEECERRDAKGLYARARRGEIPHFPGVGEPFEAPEAPDFTVTPSSFEDALDRLPAKLRSL
ncbi:MAG: adenylyl-sulfate kinase [Acidobacteria bacterium]|nr:adenylyl-sulfate kinase [Acidobacteriota bacterium]